MQKRHISLLFFALIISLHAFADMCTDSLLLQARQAIMNGDYHQGITLAEEVVRLTPKDSIGIRARGHLTLSSAYFRLGELDDALDCAHMALKLNEQIKDSFQMSCALNNMTAVLMEQMKLEEAEKCITRSLILTRATCPPNACPLAIRLGMLGELLQRQGRYQEAFDTTLLAFHIDSVAGREAKMGCRYSQLGICYECLQDYSKAETYLRAAAPLLEQYEDHSSAAINYNALARVLGRQNRNREAVMFGRLAEKIARQYQMRQTLLTCLITLSEVAPGWQERYEYMKEAYDLSEDTYTHELQDKTADLAVKYKLAEHQLQAEQLAHKNFCYIMLATGLLIVILVILVIGSFLIIRQHRINQKKVEAAAFRFAQGEKGEPDSQLAETLTDREKEVIKLCCQGLSSKQIADKMALSPRTVEGHKHSAFHKLHVNTTTELVIYAMQHGLT